MGAGAFRPQLAVLSNPRRGRVRTARGRGGRTVTTPLVDHDSRHRIATSHDETLFVEAGAGSGKTASLVTRVVALIGSGVPVTEIAAITFTEAAAAELRTRVRQTLEAAERGEPIRDVDTTDELRARAGAALDVLD